MGKDLRIILLFDFYRNILTEKQIDVIDYYYNEDLSLAEISEHMGITRQGVRDSLKRAEATLVEMEEKLGLAARYSEMQRVIGQISQEIEALEQLEQTANQPWVGIHLTKLKALLLQIEE